VLIASVALVAACAHAPEPLSTKSARSVGAGARVEATTVATTEATTEGTEPVVVPPPDVETAIEPPPEAFTGPPPPAQPPAPQLAQAEPPAGAGPTGTGVWSVVIGINDYPGSSHDLESARNDATDMDAALARFRVPGQQRVVLYDGQATADVIRRALDWLVLNAGPEATAVFMFAGHVRKLAPRSEAFIGADGRAVTDTEVARRLSGLQAAKTWLVVAACYGGGFNEALAPGRILTAAASPNDLAYESSELHRSYLGEYLTHQALLQGRADDNVEQAFAWAWAGLRRDHPNRMPVQYDQVAGDLVLGAQPIPPRPASSPPPPPSSSQPPPPSTTTTTTPPRDSRQCLMSAGTLISCDD
jgi:hypothetical protein